MKTKIAFALLLLPLAACAKTPESIGPAYMSEIPYKPLTCQQLGEEDARVQNALVTASQQQSNARSGDILGVILIGVPVSSMSGDNIAPQIANLKGQREAIQRTMLEKGC